MNNPNPRIEANNEIVPIQIPFELPRESALHTTFLKFLARLARKTLTHPQAPFHTLMSHHRTCPTTYTSPFLTITPTQKSIITFTCFQKAENKLADLKIIIHDEDNNVVPKSILSNRGVLGLFPYFAEKFLAALDKPDKKPEMDGQHQILRMNQTGIEPALLYVILVALSFGPDESMTHEVKLNSAALKASNFVQCVYTLHTLYLFGVIDSMQVHLEEMQKALETVEEDRTMKTIQEMRTAHALAIKQQRERFDEEKQALNLEYERKEEEWKTKLDQMEKDIQEMKALKTAPKRAIRRKRKNEDEDDDEVQFVEHSSSRTQRSRQRKIRRISMDSTTLSNGSVASPAPAVTSAQETPSAEHDMDTTVDGFFDLPALKSQESEPEERMSESDGAESPSESELLSAVLPWPKKNIVHSRLRLGRPDTNVPPMSTPRVPVRRRMRTSGVLTPAITTHRAAPSTST